MVSWVTANISGGADLIPLENIEEPRPTRNRARKFQFNLIKSRVCEFQPDFYILSQFHAIGY